MRLELLHSAGVGEALAKILEGLPLLNELQRDAGIPAGFGLESSWCVLTAALCPLLEEA